MRMSVLLALTLTLSAAGVGVGAPAGAAPATSCPSVCVTPPPTGPHAVGRTSLPPHGGHTKAVTAWYPAKRGTGTGTSLLSAPTADALREYFGLPDLSEVRTYARQDATVAMGSARPVVLLSPGYGLVSELYSSTAEELASHGYVVLGIDPKPENPVVEPTSEQLDARVQGLEQAVAAVASGNGPLAEVVDVRRIGALGHSFGGAAAVNAVGDDVDSAVDLDGSVFGPVVDGGAEGPTLLLSSLPCLDPTQAAFTAASSPDRVTARHLLGSTHYTFSDIVHFGEDAGGSLDGPRAAAVQREVLLRWFGDTVLSSRQAPARVASSMSLVPVVTACATER